MLPQRARRSGSPEIDRLPPHSIEAEQGILGCIFLDPGICIPKCEEQKVDAGVFYDLRHQRIYGTILEIKASGAAVDLITIQQKLKDQQQLEAVGGLTYLSSLSDAVPSASNLEYYLGIVREKYLLRKAVQACTELVSQVYSDEGDVDRILDGLQRSVETLGLERSALAPRKLGEEFRPKRLMEFNPAADPNCLIGDRWLCRGYPCIVQGPTGVGKSSLAMQAACLWALGTHFFGVQPREGQRIKSLFIQAENDEGDLAEAFQGVYHGLKLDEVEGSLDILEENIVVRNINTLVAGDFISALRELIKQYKVDVVWIDPLQAYVGDDITQAKVLGQFFRQMLNGVLQETGVVAMIMHHVTKPNNNNNNGKGRARNESPMADVYAGAGGAELFNWTRAVCSLKPRHDGAFDFIFAKRGRRAGALDLDGNRTIKLTLQHSSVGICWEQIESNEPDSEGDGNRAAGRPKIEFDYFNFINDIRGEFFTWNKLMERAAQFASVSTRSLKRRKDIVDGIIKRLHFDAKSDCYSVDKPNDEKKT